MRRKDRGGEVRRGERRVRKGMMMMRRRKDR